MIPSLQVQLKSRQGGINHFNAWAIADGARTHTGTQTLICIWALKHTHTPHLVSKNPPNRSSLLKREGGALNLLNGLWGSELNLNQNRLQIMSSKNRWFFKNCIFQTILIVCSFFSRAPLSPAVVIIIISPFALNYYISPSLTALSWLKGGWPISKKEKKMHWGPSIASKS